MSVPKLRFKEFKGDWEVKKLEDLLLFKNGINATKEQYGKGVKFINVMDIINNDFIYHDKIIGCVDVTEKTFEDNKVEYGDVLFQRSSETREEVGQASVYVDKNKSATFGGFIIRGKKIGEYNPIFMNFLLKTDLIRKDITDKSGGSTRYNVGQDTLKTVAIQLPSISEQTKIADFLMTVDEKIAQLTQKCELLARYKKGVMQQLFSQELRFKDDDGRDFPDWKEKELGQITNYTKGFAFKSEDYQLSGTRIVRVSDLNSTTIKQDNQMIFIDPLKVVDFGQYKLNQNDIVITTVGSKPELIESAVGRGILILRENEGLLNQNMLKLNQSKDIDNRFLFSQINSNRYIDHIKNIQRGNANQSNITVKDLMKFQVFVPILQEQTKIANFLTILDEKITQTQTYLETVKQYKQGLLQQMFI